MDCGLRSAAECQAADLRPSRSLTLNENEQGGRRGPRDRRIEGLNACIALYLSGRPFLVKVESRLHFRISIYKESQNSLALASSACHTRRS